MRVRRNGWDELAFPAPESSRAILFGQVSGKCHRLPWEGSFLLTKRHGSQAVSGVMATAAKAVGRQHGGIIRKPSDAWLIRDSGSRGERSRSQTVSCNCEPVWGKRVPAVKDESQAVRSIRCRNRIGKEGNPPRGVSGNWEGTGRKPVRTHCWQ
jgi:hypothetical protein